ncbi:hypothetical protein [Phytopseudomonas seleniipraecipitans]|uniref:Uncharacterized protein n=1 Tax=Phytopseudomonas seleniipraecipitans TaxID=640205 RepID=A0A1G7J6A2_9GAMM|nr:hypothetical protein [Pseudomonas seleniipraecipitans]SDF20527.1 hypothetical protein SAMN05216381_1001 [Pseudomonas seleniipraecipitans]
MAKSVEKNKGIKFKRREWLFLLLIVVLVQLILHQVSLYYGSSSTALGYVSFAGTIVSILLGLIAIIYSFVQSISHANSVAEIKSQVKHLVSAGDRIVKLEKRLDSSAVKIERLTDNYIASIDENTKASLVVAQNIKDVYQVGEVMGAGDRSDGHFSSGYTWLNIGCAIVWWAVVNNKTAYDFEIELGDVLARELDVHQEFLSGLMVAMSAMLDDKGVIEVTNVNEGVSFNGKPGFDDYIGPTITAMKESGEEKYIKLWQVLN